MIIQENLTIKDRPFIKTYSDKGFMIEREGILYDVAYDPIEFDREYTETDKPIEEEA